MVNLTKKLSIAILILFCYLFSTRTIFASSSFTWSVNPSQGTVYSTENHDLEYYFYFACSSDNVNWTTFSRSIGVSSNELFLTRSNTYDWCRYIRLYGFSIYNRYGAALAPQNYVYQGGFSFTVGYLGSYYNSPYYDDKGNFVQSVNTGTRPIMVNHTNSWFRYSDWPSWQSQLNSSHIQVLLNSEIEPVDSTPAWGQDNQQQYSFRTFNYNFSGLFQYLGTPTQGWNIAFGSNKSSNPDFELISFDNATNWSLRFYKGNLVFVGNDALVDSSTSEIVTSVNNLGQTVTNNTQREIDNQNQIAAQQEQAAQQRQEEIMNSDTASGEASISNFMTTFDAGADPSLAGVITKPLEFIQALTTQACTPLVLPLPFVGSDLTLPCGREYLSRFAAPLLQLWDIISVGLISYWIATHLYVMIYEFKNPDNDGNIQPLDL